MSAGLMRPGLARQFMRVWHRDGPTKAMLRARGYLARRVLDKGPVYAPALAPASGPADPMARMWRHLAQQDAFHITRGPKQAAKFAVIADLNLPQCRKYRVEQLVDLWAKRDVPVEYAHYEDVPRATRILQDASHLILYRVQSGPLITSYMYEARRLRLPVLYDIDDPLFSVQAYETYQNMAALPEAMKDHFVAQAPRYLDCLNAADMVSVSTPGLAAHLQLLTNRPVAVRRNFADLETLGAGQTAMAHSAPPDGMFRVAFASGSMGHEIDFATIAPQVSAFLNGAENRRLLVLGHFDTGLLAPDLAARVEAHPFTDYPSYLQHLAQADCAVMPLADDLFNQCKSAVRVLDAAAVGVPALVPTVGDMQAVVRHRKTGAILGDGGDWAATLTDLATRPETCWQMGLAARADVEKTWTAKAQAQALDPALAHWATPSRLAA